MLIRTALFIIIMTVSAAAFHEHTFAVWELRELLLERTINLWELLEQLEYVTDEQRVKVYEDIEGIRQQINTIIHQLLEHDRSQHP